MRDRFLRSMMTVAHRRGRRRRHHFGVHHTDFGSGSGGSGAKNAVGEPDLQVHLDRRDRNAASAPCQIREPRIFHCGTASRIG